YAVGAAYLRGQAKTKPRPGDKPLVIQAVHGLDEVQREFGEHIIDGKIPIVGAPQAQTYEGDGFLIVRHDDSDVARKIVQQIVSRVRVDVG
ncbi:MAG: hypothetical protein ACI9SE_004346, partial [Neolewinella sp.]